ncbi:MAG TPA: tetratricopeptide repeat protein [candidate division Zixibacteria bacterium]|nr:tetratricopeptide repeat protein [candidate division Zixibacteria bacterium]
MKIKFLVLILTAAFLASCGNDKSPEELLALGRKSFAGGDYLQARKYLSDALKLKPTDKELVVEMGKIYAADNMFDSAFAHLSRADKLYPGDRQINIMLHDASVKTEHWKDAIQTQILLVQSGDSTADYYRRIGRYALVSRTGHVADFYFEKLIELEPDSLNHYMNQAEGAFISGETQKSMDVLKSALKRFGDNPILLNQLGKIYGVLGELSESEKYYRVLAQKDSSVVNRLQLAAILAQQPKKAKKEEAYAMFKKLRTQTPDFFRVDSFLVALEKELSVRQ